MISWRRAALAHTVLSFPIGLFVCSLNLEGISTLDVFSRVRGLRSCFETEFRSDFSKSSQKSSNPSTWIPNTSL